MVEGMELQTSEKTEKMEKADFSIILHPHRSLSERSFLILMICIGIVSLGTGIIFLAMGAWTVLGFFGLDVFLVYRMALRYKMENCRHFWDSRSSKRVTVVTFGVLGRQNV